MSDYKADISSASEINSNQVVLLLSALARELRHLADEMDELEMTMVHAKEDYTRAYAKQYLDESGSVEDKKQRTLWKTQDARLAAEIAETMVKAQARKMKTLERRIEVARSAAALVRMEADLMNVRR
jgi:6-pyruvoyl-tetrahydropterin synthase